MSQPKNHLFASASQVVLIHKAHLREGELELSGSEPTPLMANVVYGPNNKTPAYVDLVKQWEGSQSLTGGHASRHRPGASNRASAGYRASAGWFIAQ